MAARWRVLLPAAAAGLVLAAVVTAHAPLSELLLRWRMRVALERLLEGVRPEQLPVARFSAIPSAAVQATTRGASPLDLQFDAKTGRVLALGDDSASPDIAAAVAAAFALRREPSKAIRILQTAAARNGGDPRIWNDLSAAHLEANHLLPALVAADRALRISPDLPSALHNRALVLERLGLPTMAAAVWQRCLNTTTDASLAAIVRQRLAEADAPSEKQQWGLAEKQLIAAAAGGDQVRVDSIAREFPSGVRRSGEVLYLASWARELPVDAAKASEWLDVARAAGAALSRRNETMLAGAVAAIDDAVARRDESRIAILARAHLDYHDGRLAYSTRDFAPAERRLASAAQSFRTARSRLEHAARAAQASVLIDMARVDEARTMLNELVASERLTTHRALVAGSTYLLALCETLRGRWNEAIDNAKESARLFADLGETLDAAVSENLIADVFNLLGRHEEGWEYRVRAFRATTQTGAVNRLLIAAGSGTRAAMRARDFDTALSLSDIELALAEQVKNPSFTADMLTRRAQIQHERGVIADRDTALARAHIAVGSVQDRSERERLTIELESVDGVIARRASPRRAIESLSQAIAFCRDTNRRVYLPSVLLERGRAYVAAGDDERAAEDFDAAIAEIEARRGAISDLALRSRLLDTEEELFDDAIALHVRRGDAETAFSISERARARALLDVLSGSPQPVTTSAAIAARLPRDTVLLEYVVLPDRIVIFSIRRDGMRMHTVNAARDVLTAQADLAPVLLEPVREELATAANLIVVPDRILQRVPFGALRFGGRYLVQRHVITVAPSASRIVAMARPEARREPSALIVGNPSGDAELRLESLPSVEREIAAVRSCYRTARVLTGRDATRARFTASAPEHDLIHFAGHGVSDDESFSASLLFARGEQDSGRMYMDDIARLRLTRAPLVVLSACGTVRGPVSGVEGMPSLARSFLLAGASAVVGALTEVDDAHAAALLSSFHRHLADGATPAEALRNAQVEQLARGGESASPEHWAPFVVYGGYATAPE